MTVAIILPLFDREGTGWKSLESALAQDIARSSYEVVAIIGGGSEEDVRGDAHAQALLSQCDAVVRYGEDLDTVENRMSICRAGAQAVSADILFLAEGHTVLRPDACAAIARHFAANPQSQALFAGRLHHSGTTCSEIQEYLNTHNLGRNPVPKVFSLGGESALRRELFDAMVVASEQSGPFAETIIQYELQARGIPVATLDAPLCDHFNNWTAKRSMQSAMMLGNAYFQRFDLPMSRALGIAGRKRAAFALARRAWIAAPLWPLSQAAGALCIRAGVPLFGVQKELCRVVFALGVKATVLAGFCRARIFAGASPRPRLQGQRE